MTDREMLLIAYGAMKVAGDGASKPFTDTIQLIERHIFEIDILDMKPRDPNLVKGVNTI